MRSVKVSRRTSARRGHRITSVEPGNVQWNGIGPQRILGCIVYPAAEVTQPGVVTHLEGNRFTLGEPSGEKTERAAALAALFASAGPKLSLTHLS